MVVIVTSSREARRCDGRWAEMHDGRALWKRWSTMWVQGRLTAVFDVVGSCEARDGRGLWVCINKLWFYQSHSKAAAMAEVQRKKLYHYLY
ncbi:hypothetical protein ACFX13_039408 [Malus domestica]